MTHIALPDGLIPWWLSVSGAIVALLILGGCTAGLRAATTPRALVRVALMTALLVVVKLVDILPMGYKLHGTVLAGVVVGPKMASLAAVGAEVICASIGVGAISNIGLNVTLSWLEMAGGYFVFRALALLVTRRKVALAGGLATVVSLSFATLLYIPIILISNEASYFATLDAIGATADDGGRLTNLEATTFAVLVLVSGAIGWTIEGLATGVVLALVSRANPRLIEATHDVEAPSGLSAALGPNLDRSHIGKSAFTRDLSKTSATSGALRLTDDSASANAVDSERVVR
jgi:ABC-type Co2+ transport system permease subunit